MRPDDWHILLEEHVNDYRSKQFKWGKADCATLAADWVKKLTKKDPLWGCRKYDSELGALKILKKKGVDNVGEIFGKKLEKVPVSIAARGDLMFHNRDDNTMGGMGICVGQFVLTMDPDYGMITTLRDGYETAYKVG